MSVSGWETRSATGPLALDDRRGRHQRAHADNPWSSSASQSSHVSRGHGDRPSFPVQQHQQQRSPPPPPPHQNGHYHQRAADGQQQRRQSQAAPPNERLQRHASAGSKAQMQMMQPQQHAHHRDQVPYYDQQPQQYVGEPRRASMSRPAREREPRSPPVEQSRQPEREPPIGGVYARHQERPQYVESTPYHKQPEHEREAAVNGAHARRQEMSQYVERPQPTSPPRDEYYPPPQYEQPRRQHPQDEQPRHLPPQYEQPRQQAPQYEQPRQQAPHDEQPRRQSPLQPQFEQPRRQPPQDEQPRHLPPQYEQPRQQQPQFEQPRRQPPPDDRQRRLSQQYEEPRWQPPQGEQPRHLPLQYEQPRRQAPHDEQPHRQSPLREQPRQQPPRYHEYRPNQPEDPIQYYDSLPPPLSLHRGQAPLQPEVVKQRDQDPAVRPHPSPSTSSGEMEEPVNIDDVLLGKRWSVHVISHLLHFQRQELGDYAHELVKFLRGQAVMSYEQEFGYNVMIRYTSECVVFQIVEARDLHAEFLVEKMEQPQRPDRKPIVTMAIDAPGNDVQQRSGGFVVYFPKTAEDIVRVGPNAGNMRRARASLGSRSNESDNSHGSSGTRGDPKYAFLLRGNEELMSWVCSWLQRRFQCVVGLHVVRVTEENLRRVTRNWVIEALEREEKLDKARLRKAEKLRAISAASGADMKGQDRDTRLPSRLTRAPLLMKYKTKKGSDAVKAFTLTMPWGNVRRVHAMMEGGVGSALGSVPEIVERLEFLYFGNLKKDLAEMELTGFQMEEVEVDTQGKVKFFKSTMVHSVLQSFLDIFVVQQMPGPTPSVTTF